jgi:exoribonuclease II
VRVRVTGADLLTLDLHANVLARLDDAPAADVATDTASDDAADDALDNAGPLTLAIDIHGEAQETETAAPVATA